jgi:hypothetical protein
MALPKDNTSYRKIDVDAYDEDQYVEEEDQTQGNVDQEINSRQADVRNLLNKCVSKPRTKGAAGVGRLPRHYRGPHIAGSGHLECSRKAVARALRDSSDSGSERGRRSQSSCLLRHRRRPSASFLARHAARYRKRITKKRLAKSARATPSAGFLWRTAIALLNTDALTQSLLIMTPLSRPLAIILSIITTMPISRVNVGIWNGYLASACVNYSPWHHFLGVMRLARSRRLSTTLRQERRPRTRQRFVRH